jgi:hypothetical protein
MIDIKSYDLKNREEVRALALALGEAYMQECLPALRVMEPDERFIFCSIVVANFAGAMGAALGTEMAHAVLDRLKDSVQTVVAESAAKMN